ncbi:type I-F CRISPR-associated endoribonuclease Cas6/Csy4 [Marinomonas algicola]|uniref:type I-F CRISPR-associated endoribonuclease Cas6/Csy4 n=1 Tax=Marinomonas algicola TaxID=2773454 RepID=UPI00174C26C8|nr:type I-F CRISPR-associated endoribonuclease Cas6/Csy4 [Marinomonas algicola]
MKYYLDITLLPSDDIGIHFLWSKVIMQVHLALVEIQDADKKVPVGAGFPQYREKKADKAGFVGNKLRLFSIHKEDLERLDIHKWLNRLEDYVHIKAINEVPKDLKGYENFNRRSKSGNAEKHIRRRISRAEKHNNETPEQAAEFFKDYTMSEEDKALPFINMRSLEGKKDFRMSITRKVVEPSNAPVKFNTYGLSKEGVLPKF